MGRGEERSYRQLQPTLQHTGESIEPLFGVCLSRISGCFEATSLPFVLLEPGVLVLLSSVLVLLG